MSTHIPVSDSTHTELATSSFQAAFDTTAEERAALFPSDFLTVNLDAQLAVRTVMATLPRLEMLREEIVSQLPQFDVAQFDRLKTYAEAFAQAHTLFAGASTPSNALAGLVERGMAMRDLLLADVNALTHRGLVDRKRLAELKGGIGYLNVGYDLGVLVGILRERWNDIRTNTGLKASDINDAAQLFEQITVADAEHAGQSKAAAAAADDRQRAFVLLVRAYDQAKRAAAYIRHAQGDADTILPSLWAQKGAGRPSHKNGNGNAEVPGAPATPDANAQPAVPAVPAAPPVPPVAPGLPGASPFAHG